MSRQLTELLAEHLGADWLDRLDEPGLWDRVLTIDDERLWQVHKQVRDQLHSYIREEARIRWRDRWRDPAKLAVAGTLLGPYALTIGFARRFATYKPAGLILQDLDRLRKILLDAERPVQIIFAGKAHPRDEPGKELIRQVVQYARRPEFRRRVVFLEDYDQVVARYMVQGVDVWLNTPRIV